MSTTINSTTSLTTFHDACKMVYMGCPNLIAKSYARAGMTLTTSDAQETQALYILSNINFWRGQDAKNVRQFLRTFAKVK